MWCYAEWHQYCPNLRSNYSCHAGTTNWGQEGERFGTNDCLAKLSVCYSFLSSSQGNKSYKEHTQLLEKMPYWMESQQAMHIRDIVVKSRINWVLEYLWHNNKTAVSILDRSFLILRMRMITSGLMIHMYGCLKHRTVPSTRPIAVH